MHHVIQLSALLQGSVRGASVNILTYQACLSTEANWARCKLGRLGLNQPNQKQVQLLKWPESKSIQKVTHERNFKGYIGTTLGLYRIIQKRCMATGMMKELISFHTIALIEATKSGLNILCKNQESIRVRIRLSNFQSNGLRKRSFLTSMRICERQRNIMTQAKTWYRQKFFEKICNYHGTPTAYIRIDLTLSRAITSPTVANARN